MDEELINFVRGNNISLDYIVEVLLEKEIKLLGMESSKDDVINSFKKKYFIDNKYNEILEKLYDKILINL